MNLKDRIYSLRELQDYSYRFLQQIAKSMSLPSNFKKVYLIQLIHTKQFGTVDEVNNIVHKVKLERLQMSQMKKKSRSKTHLQGSEISSTSNSHSPPITITPKRHVVLNRGPINAVVKCQNMLEPRIIKKTYPSPRNAAISDRILRSFNIKTVKKTNYGNLNMNSSLYNVIKAQNSVSPRRMGVKLNGENRMHNPKWNVTTNCFVKKQNQSVLMSSNFNSMNNERSQYPTTSHVSSKSIVPAKRTNQRVLSGIYPITPRSDAPKPNSYIHSIGIRHRDGKLTKINALVQKSKTPLKAIANKPQNTSRNIQVTVQDLIESNIDNQSNTTPICSTIESNLTNSQLYPNMSSLNDVIGKHMCYLDGERNCLDNTDYIEGYCHKKIRGEQIRSQNSHRKASGNDKLPRINEVFSRFNDINSDVMQPIYVQVSEESDRLKSYPIYVPKSNSNNTNLLETLYNFKNQFVVHQPLAHVTTTANTTCTYSTAVVATPYAKQSTLATNDSFPDTYTASSCEQDSVTSVEIEMEDMPRLCDLLKFAEQDDNMRSTYNNEDELCTSGSTLVKTSSQDLGASVTIPEMVEDALEIISQDGDYMERLGMDVRMQCILCTWAGPKFILEYHIKQEHAHDIGQIPQEGWKGTLRGAGERDENGGEGVQGGEEVLSARRLLQRDDSLYILSATRREGCLVVTLCSVSTEPDLPKTGSITIYNKSTGEPYTWDGEIQEIPDDITCDDETNCLKLETARLGLSPNKCLEYEMTIESSTTMDDAELDDAHVVMFVKILN